MLLENLKFVFFRNPFPLMGSYLVDGRSQCVSHNESSDWLTVTEGVSQGSILGPLIFTMYVNDTDTVIPNFILMLTNSKYTLTVSNLNDTIARINDIIRLSLWSVNMN